MQLIITRPVVLTGDSGTRSFVPGLTVEVDAADRRTDLGAAGGHRCRACCKRRSASHSSPP